MIQRESCLVAFAHVFPPDRYPFPEDAVRRHWLQFAGTVLVAERDGHPVGVAGVAPGWLTNLYVLPDEWGAGVGGTLHDAALAELVDAEVRLWTLEANHRARRFYEKRGWEPNGQTRVVEYPPNPLDVGYSLRRRQAG